jgi:hypothetical protein
MVAMTIAEQPVQAPSAATAYRLLRHDEWDRIAPIFEQQGHVVPHPEIANVAIAESADGQILGFLMLQMVLHAEPLWIDESERGKVSWKRLLGVLESLFEGPSCYYVFAPDEHVARMAEAVGMEKLPYAVFQKEMPCRS